MVLVIATAGLVYELGMASVASYVLGDSIRQFSIVIGVYLSALGLGAYLSRFINQGLAIAFVQVELGTALVGGLSAPGLFIAFSHGATFELLLLLVVTAVGTLVGIELPLLMRILERQMTFKDLVARALTYDYAGALLGSLGFSLLLVPKLGLARSSIVCGLLNAGVGLVATWFLSDPVENGKRQMARARITSALTILLLGGVYLGAPRIVAYGESRLLGRVTSTIDTPYQRISLVERDGADELYLNGHLQFSSRDECRYHEALVHPAMSLSPSPKRILVGGGGDGLAVREILKWSSVTSVTLVDLDPTMTDLARTHPRLVRKNRSSFQDPRVTIVNQDAFLWVQNDNETYDVVILDFPDPTTFGVGKLFSSTFYARLKRLLNPHAILAVQSTSPLTSNESFWSILTTIDSTGFSTLPLRVFLPSFGDWGFVIASDSPVPPNFAPLPTGITTCLDGAKLDLLRLFPSDTRHKTSQVNRLDNQSLVDTYVREAARFD
jgi:spermidine synthase